MILHTKYYTDNIKLGEASLPLNGNIGIDQTNRDFQEKYWFLLFYFSFLHQIIEACHYHRIGHDILLSTIILQSNDK